MLDGCWFETNKAPKWPHHPFCHCVLEELSYDEVMTKSTVYSAYEKFAPYLFDPEDFYKHGKSKMLELWGYSVSDSKYLQEIIEKQGLEKYRKGDYQLGRLNKYGQRISIRVEIPHKKHNGNVSFITGWTVRANGQITLNTPYGGE